jgi:hypothetical protein
MPLTHEQKARRFAHTVKRMKTAEEKRERAHIIAQYCIAVLAEGHKKTKLPGRTK